MSEYDNTNTGALFKADKKSDKHPDYTGSLNAGGKDYFISSWLKTSKAGTKFMSLSVTEKDGAISQKPAPKSQESFDDQDIPF